MSNMAKIDDLGLQKYPVKKSIIGIDTNETKRLAYMQGMNDTLINLKVRLQTTRPNNLPEFIDSVLSFMESYYE